MKENIVRVLAKESGLALNEIDNLIEIPKDPALGDFAFPCFTLAKKFKKNPVEIAKDLGAKISVGKEIEKINVVGPYINFFVAKGLFVRETLQAASKSSFGKGNSKGSVIMDYSHPNVAKHFGVHNLRSTLIGHAIYNILKTYGKKVVSVNHLGDWGTQFGKLIVAYNKWGEKSKLKDIAYLNSLYVKFHTEAEKHVALEDEARAAFSALERGDKKSLALWRKFLTLSLKEFNKTYKILGIKFDQIKGESFYRKDVKPLIAMLEKKGILEESEGAQVVKFDDVPPAIIAKSDEASTYATRDLAAVFERMKSKPDTVLYVVDVRQSLHFEQVFRVAEKLGVDRKKLVHAKFGLMKFPDMDMSTRKGNVILFEDLLKRGKEEVLKIINSKNPSLKNKEKVAQAIALAAIIFNDVQSNRIHDVVFSWEQALNFEGKSAPYLMYTYARAKSILRKKKAALPNNFGEINEKEFALVKKISEFPQTIERAAEAYEPHIIAEYAHVLAQTFNEFYHAEQVIGSEREAFRLSLVASFAQVLKNALNLLGIPVLEEM